MATESVISIESHRSAVLAKVLASELDFDSSGVMRDAVMAAGAESPRLPVVLDLSEVELVPSVALGALITLTRVFQENRQRFIIAGVKPDIHRTLVVCHLDKLFEIHESPQAALSQL